MKIIYNNGTVAECPADEELHVIRHSAAHIMAQAVMHLYPQADFAYGPATHRSVDDRWVPYICLASPLLCLLIDTVADNFAGYKFGYEMLMLNGGLTFAGLWISGGERRAS